MLDPKRSPSEDDQSFVPQGEPRPLPAGMAVTIDPDTWYYFRAHYLSESGQDLVGYFCPLGSNAAESFWDYIVMRPDTKGACQFKLEDTDGRGWSNWLIKADGNHLCLKATGWFYRASAYTTRFAILDGELHNDYWSGPAGSSYRSTLVSSGYYVGQDLGDEATLTNCELVPVGVPADASVLAAAQPSAVSPV
jgi:hypothetical protein